MDDNLLHNRTFDELAIGESASLVRTAGQDDIQLFAAMSGDVNPAHMDAAFAANDMFGHVVVQGMWTAGLISALLGTRLPGPGTIYLDQDLQFRHPVVPGDVGTYGGVVTDEFARVLREDRTVIPGLYATGVSTASVMGRAYPGAGSSVGPSFTFGYVAASHAKEQRVDFTTRHAPAAAPSAALETAGS